MAKGTIVVMLRAERWRAFARAENQAGLRPGIRLVHQVSRGRSVQFGMNNAAKATMNPTAPPIIARPPGDCIWAISALLVPSSSRTSAGRLTSIGSDAALISRITAATHCHGFVRVAGAAASRNACISGTLAARRAAPRPPSTLNSAVTSTVAGMQKTGIDRGRSRGNRSNSRHVSR